MVDIWQAVAYNGSVKHLRGVDTMSGGAIKKLRRAKIKQQLKEQREAKLAKEMFSNITEDMTDEDWDELGKELAEQLGVDSVDIKDKEEE